MSDSITRREILTKAAWVAPVIMTFPAVASFAKAGSSDHKDHKEKAKAKDKKEKWHRGAKEK